MKTSVLKPGFLVSLKSSLRGGVNYRRVDLQASQNGESIVTKWETTKEIEDPAEYNRAIEARSEARALVVRVCCSSAFGLLCPSDREQELQEAIEAARDIARQHNRTAQRSQVEVYVLVGRIAQDDAEAARAIASEVRELLDSMKAGIAACDPEAIRQAANKARALGGMLSADVAGKVVTKAIEQARSAAREIVRRVEKAGIPAARVIEACNTAAIDAARFAFLDLDEGGTIERQAPEARGIDLPAVDNGDGTRDPMNEAGAMVEGNAAAGGFTIKTASGSFPFELEV